MDDSWIWRLPENVFSFLNQISSGKEPGRYRPALQGLTPEGETATLGFSCFALKIHYMLDRWDKYDSLRRRQWLDLIKSFQQPEGEGRDLLRENAFIDPVLTGYLEQQDPLSRRLLRRVLKRPPREDVRRAIVSETKQAIATLHQVGEPADRPYRGYPTEHLAVWEYLHTFDWSQPWSAGAHFAVLCVMAATQAPLWLSEGEVKDMREGLIKFIEKMVNPSSGAYFQGAAPDYDMMINGAMKVLTGLDWLDESIHYPERLIDAALSRVPRDEGCHLVDAVYVLYRCARQTQYRRQEIVVFCNELLPMIRRHLVVQEGGFSYGAGRSQTSYYGLPISQGLRTADIHGTILLVWALVMILELAECLPEGWRTIRP